MHTSSQIHQTLAACPAPSPRRIALRVTAAAQGMLRHGHPWLYDQAIRRQSHEGQAGDLAVVFDRDRRFLAIGLYDPTSPIRVRVLQSKRPARIDRSWFDARLRSAASLRASLPDSGTTGYRLVHGENDGLPGLVVDRYERTLVIKLYTVAWVPYLRDLVEALRAVCPVERIVLRLSRTIQEQREHLHGLTNGLILFGPALDGPVVFQEHGLRFEVDPARGQKTGFFLDQRDNRARVERLCTGRSVLDTFAYTGGFSVYAARGGAREVLSVDVSRPALEAAARNVALNRDHPAVAASKHDVVCGDVFDVLRRLRQQRRMFEVVILDPPSFAKSRDEILPALAAYGRLTRLGLDVLQPDGILVASSCSSHVSAEVFCSTVHRAAVKAGRPLRELERTGHALDHPVSFQEGAYLKCLFSSATSRQRRRRSDRVEQQPSSRARSATMNRPEAGTRPAGSG